MKLSDLAAKTPALDPECEEDSHPGVTVAAPMVRYSKLAFRNLLRLWECDVVYTPMILADAFSRSSKARDNEFTTNEYDTPLIVQFASPKAEPFVEAAQLVQDHCMGVNLNCGCPQGWAVKEGIGACLIHRPELVQDLVRQSRRRCKESLDISIKIRIHADPKDTVEFARQMEAAGIDHITVHGRTRQQRSDPVNWECVSDIKKSLRIPVIANGDIRSLGDALTVREVTGVDGVMAARGLLKNPAMFSADDYQLTPVECISDWLSLSLETGTPFTCFHHHLIYMCERLLPRSERRVFNTLSSTAGVLDYLRTNYDITPSRDVEDRLEERYFYDSRRWE